jgi:phage tail sheath protein FI
LVLTRDNLSRINTHFANLLELLRQTPLDADVATVREPFGNLMLLARASALALRTLEEAGLPTVLTQAVASVGADAKLAGAIIELVVLEKNSIVRTLVASGRTVANVNTDYEALDETAWISSGKVADIVANAPIAGTNPIERALNAAAALQQSFEKIAAAVLSIFSAAEFLAGQAEKQMFDKHPVYRDVAEQVKRTMSLLPVSGAVAGVYAAVDRARGVWKAPANVSLADVSGPAVKINDAGQADLNVSTTGKSVNAVRAFAGKGTLIWGARTLAGNDNEWRYVPVRRFFNMAEESIKKATEPFVFEPNDANTWVRVRAMIENFLTIQWRQGALTGATTAQAFYVKLGLGETMTAQDILEGRMIVEVGMAVVRPAEFIILKFAHKMQVS